MKYTIDELANSKGVSQPVREALLQMADYKQLYEQVCEQYDVLAKELEATNRQVEILSDALAESQREVAALVQPVAWLYPEGLEALKAGKCWTAYGTKQDDNCNIPVHLNAAVAPKVEPAKAECDGFDSHSAAPVQPVATLFGSLPVYDTTPFAQRTWVDLTDDDLVACSDLQKATVLYFMKKLKEKNHDPMQTPLAVDPIATPHPVPLPMRQMCPSGMGHT